MSKRRRRGKMKRVDLVLFIGRGPEAVEILQAIKDMAKDRKLKLVDFVLSACFNQGTKKSVEPESLPKTAVEVAPPPKTSNPPVKRTTSFFVDEHTDDPLPSQGIETSEMPAGKPASVSP